jgi:hypothetical protein
VIGESGKRLGSHVVETNGQALIEQLKTLPGEKHVCLEERTQSAWLYEILSPHAEEVVVAMVSESRGQKDDQRDAFGLAERLRTGAIERKVFKEAGEYKALRELARTHAMVVQDVVRVQNRIKALFRSRGVAVSGKSVYSEKGREESLAKLPDTTRGAAKTLSRSPHGRSRRKATMQWIAAASSMAAGLARPPWLEPRRSGLLASITPGRRAGRRRSRTRRPTWWAATGIERASARTPNGTCSASSPARWKRHVQRSRSDRWSSTSRRTSAMPRRGFHPQPSWAVCYRANGGPHASIEKSRRTEVGLAP